MKRLSSIIEEHEDLRLENRELHEALAALKRDYEHVSKQLMSLQHQLERTNETKEVVNLCRLMLAGSLVPVASMVLIYSFIDGSIFVAST